MVGCSLSVAVSLGFLHPTAGSRFPCRQNARTELERKLAGAIAFALMGRVYLAVLFSSGRVTHGVLQFGGMARNRVAAGCGSGWFGTNQRSLVEEYSECPCGAGTGVRHAARLSAYRLLTRSK